MVVGAEEVAPPIIERVEEPVLQDDPAVLSDHSTVVPEAFFFLHEAAIQDACPLYVSAGNPAPSQQHQREERVGQPRDVTHPRQAAPACAELLPRPIRVLI